MSSSAEKDLQEKNKPIRRVMKDDDNDLADVALIERFMEGKLSEEERTATLQRLENDPEFALLFEDLKVLTAGIRKNSRDKLVTFIKTIDVPERREQKGDTNFDWEKYGWTLAIAAVLILGIGITWWNATVN